MASQLGAPLLDFERKRRLRNQRGLRPPNGGTGRRDTTQPNLVAGDGTAPGVTGKRSVDGDRTGIGDFERRQIDKQRQQGGPNIAQQPPGASTRSTRCGPGLTRCGSTGFSGTGPAVQPRPPAFQTEERADLGLPALRPGQPQSTAPPPTGQLPPASGDPRVQEAGGAVALPNLGAVIERQLGQPTAFEEALPSLREAAETGIREQAELDAARRGLTFSSVPTGQISRGLLDVEADLQSRLAQSRDRGLRNAIQQAMQFGQAGAQQQARLDDLALRLGQLGFGGQPNLQQQLGGLTPSNIPQGTDTADVLGTLGGLGISLAGLFV